MEKVYDKCCGIDVHKKLIVACLKKGNVNYSELLQLAKGWGNFVSDRINIWRLRR